MFGGPEEWIPQHVIAELFHVGSKTIKRWQEEKGFPKPVAYIGKIPFFRASAVRDWQDRQKEDGREPPKPEIRKK